MGPFTSSPRQCKQKHACTMLCNLRVGLAPPRAVNAGAKGHVLRLQVGGLFAELPHRGVLLEPGSLLIHEWRGSSCTDIHCIGVSLWPFLTLASFDVTEAQAGPYAGLSKHLFFTCSSVTLPNSPECLVLEGIYVVISVLTSGWSTILNYLFYYLAPVVLTQDSYLMFCKCSPHSQCFVLRILIVCVLVSTRDLSPGLAQS